MFFPLEQERIRYFRLTGTECSDRAAGYSYLRNVITEIVEEGRDRDAGVGYYERYGFVQDHVVKNFFTDNYPEPIIDNGKPCVDMTYLRLQIR